MNPHLVLWPHTLLDLELALASFSVRMCLELYPSSVR